ncbi:hypothetical protein LTR10_017826 [Elasticomyces elasticus]|uniref:HpcH/HpaI aldolase/citrate lyase domain-containing protein n=1 Tax=Exophiala sideris TaxID=1016849 RepID=A0ABR0J0V9_9EURO|nr:hypothetical protein LTR10_017826 [Elasticomyces elasticus]KAK5023825.1 hypothetical protein LTS07_008950 [Exophiala sideris]KAK5030156.1 hypothetical protein LTR13_008469 [Exophiala sideris]KAK5053651.1 hypothetical protein LTR69_009296 [Exophiala sideris]KAK5179306.1 hypothetical protein LTR44_008144 [Eurotiomycetes sp. CCFEE 6388]
MGVVFPHVSSRVEAEAAVSISKYPPQGKRSMTGQLPQFCMVPQTAPRVTGPSNDIGSTVFVMIETREGIDNLDDIASVKGVDVLLVGANDLSVELGMPADFENQTFQAALERVSDACKKHHKIMGLGGIYDRPELQKWAIDKLGVGFMLCQQDAGLITKGAKQCIESLKALQKSG